eukprot:2201-Pleurochrysis_carterae.AAC.1
MVRVLPKRHSVLVDSQSWLTDSNESRNEGTQRTLRRVMRWTFPRESTASRGMSPINSTRCGLPSTPEMTSSVVRVFTRSLA